jgi:hypothetical protein
MSSHNMQVMSRIYQKTIFDMSDLNPNNLLDPQKFLAAMQGPSEVGSDSEDSKESERESGYEAEDEDDENDGEYDEFLIIQKPEPASIKGWRRYSGWLTDNEINRLEAAETRPSSSSSSSISPTIRHTILTLNHILSSPLTIASSGSTTSISARSFSTEADWAELGNTAEYCEKFNTVNYKQYYDATDVFDVTDNEGEHFRNPFSNPHKDDGWEGAFFDRRQSTEYSPGASVRSDSTDWKTVEEDVGIDKDYETPDDDDGEAAEQSPSYGKVVAQRDDWELHFANFSGVWEIASVYSDFDLSGDDESEDPFRYLDVEALIESPHASGYSLIDNDTHPSKSNSSSKGYLPEKEDPIFNFLPQDPERGCGCHWCQSHYHPTPDDASNGPHDPNQWCHCPACEICAFQRGFRELVSETKEKLGEKVGKTREQELAEEMSEGELEDVMRIRRDAIFSLQPPTPSTQEGKTEDEASGPTTTETPEEIADILNALRSPLPQEEEHDERRISEESFISTSSSPPKPTPLILAQLRTAESASDKHYADVLQEQYDMFRFPQSHPHPLASHPVQVELEVRSPRYNYRIFPRAQEGDVAFQQVEDFQYDTLRSPKPVSPSNAKGEDEYDEQKQPSSRGRWFGWVRKLLSCEPRDHGDEEDEDEE